MYKIDIISDKDAVTFSDKFNNSEDGGVQFQWIISPSSTVCILCTKHNFISF